MTVSPIDRASRAPLHPYGLVLQAKEAGADVRELDPRSVAELVVDARVVVLRGFTPLEKAELVAYCRRWGEILTWDFGEVLDLIEHENPKNYLFTNGPVPYHWDGAFARATPSYIVFQCLQAPSAGTGGETIFCDTVRLVEMAPPERVAEWESVRIGYRTEKVEHYGGQIEIDLLSRHPRTGARTIRYAEPLDPKEFLNPLFLEISGLPEGREQAFLDDMHERLYRPDLCYAHEWRDGDLVIVDNNCVLHGRNAYRADSSRRLQRVHVL